MMQIVKYVIEHRPGGPVILALLDTGEILELPGISEISAHPENHVRGWEPARLSIVVTDTGDLFELRIAKP